MRIGPVSHLRSWFRQTKMDELQEEQGAQCYCRAKYKNEINYVAVPYNNISSATFIKNSNICANRRNFSKNVLNNILVFQLLAMAAFKIQNNGNRTPKFALTDNMDTPIPLNGFVDIMHDFHSGSNYLINLKPVLAEGEDRTVHVVTPVVRKF